MAESIPKTMKAAQLIEFKKKYEIREIPVPQLGENDLLLKMGAAGFCHTDYQVWEGVYGSKLPLVPSHEPVGTIVAVGSKVKDPWKVGQRVGSLLFKHQCHHCEGCKATNDVRFCENNETAGLHNDGGMAEYFIADPATTVLLPDSIPFEQAAPLMCAGATVWNGIKAGGAKPSEPVGIIGIGGLGTLAVQFAKAIGHPVVALDNRIEGKDLAQGFPLKADLVLSEFDDHALEKVKKWSGGAGLAAIVVCTDHNSAIQWSTKALRPRGVCVPLGLPVDGWKLDAFDVIFQEKTIKGSLVSTKSETDDMLACVDKFGIRSHITTVPLEKVPDLPQMYMDPHLKGRLVLKF
ncbi:alcohol dehydrogenase GroES-like domain-containing protein [Rhizodiscina lignyota]|uniref:Alcohol dehydrogenase GroES-like domain-containing protein n=1 Tax=Rhizodiscina lignyota TaxID=1504668 RepID=A0A9P4I4J3_9PEZI|nr:alcohol dehydrogenase GroES-like domain-containing protein [Rhizodiscina lignyota]